MDLAILLKSGRPLTWGTRPASLTDRWVQQRSTATSAYDRSPDHPRTSGANWTSGDPPAPRRQSASRRPVRTAGTGCSWLPSLVRRVRFPSPRSHSGKIKLAPDMELSLSSAGHRKVTSATSTRCSVGSSTRPAAIAIPSISSASTREVTPT